MVRRRYDNGHIVSLMGRLIPKAGSGYFTKNSDLDAVDVRIEKQTGVSVKAVGGFPCRLHALIDFVEWNETFNFLKPKRLLALYPDDSEVKFVHQPAGGVMDNYVFDDAKKDGDHSFGDLHYPINLKRAGTYDLVLFAQTLEHLYDPVLCLRNLYDAMAPGAFLYTTVPHLNHLHMEPFFFSMPTPYGFVLWLDMAGFKVLRVGQFGNEEYIKYLGMYTTWWPMWLRYYNATRRPQIINDPTRPVQTWALVQKPLKETGRSPNPA